MYGLDLTTWKEVAGGMLPFDEIWGATVGTLVGCWLGAIPIPLDWDRAWQKWPVTVVTGAYAGWAVGRFLGAWVLRGRRIKFD